MLFVNTRPQDRAQALTLALSEQNIEVVELALLELQAIEFNTELAALYQKLLTSEVIVVVSPTAVEIGMQYLQKKWFAFKSTCTYSMDCCRTKNSTGFGPIRYSRLDS